MVENIEVRILWLSDVHFKDVYELSGLERWWKESISELKANEADPDKIAEKTEKINLKFEDFKNRRSALDKYFENFISTVKDYPKKIDYVLISGDLGFTSSKEDYQALFNVIVSKLKNILPKRTQFLSIPGNHDVFWANTSFFDAFLKKISKLYDAGHKNFSDLRQEYLVKRKDFFDLIFTNYSNFFRTNIVGELGKNKIEVKNYQKAGLFGFIIDKENNLAINFLNSAWYALGQQFDYILLKAFLKRYNESIFNNALANGKATFDIEFEKCLKELIIVKNSSLEYGGQIIGISKRQETEIFKKALENSNYFVITTFHHPTSWLQYKEKYAWEIQKNDNLFLNKILNRTELLLTGHEHVPSSVNYERVNNHAIHLKGGMFMQDDMFIDNQGQQRFSILEINTSKFKFNEKKYYYDWKNTSWKLDSNFSLFNIPIEKKQPIFNSSKIEHYIKSLHNINILCELLEKYFFVNENIRKLYKVKQFYSNTEYSLVKFVSEGMIKRIVIIAKNFNFFNSILKKDVSNGSEHFFTTVMKRLTKYDKEVKITLLTPDFFVNEKMTEDYKKTEIIDKFGIYYQIVKKADFIFNISRHRFFIQFENNRANFSDKTLKINDILFNDIKGIQLSNQIIPFWIIEKFA